MPTFDRLSVKVWSGDATERGTLGIDEKGMFIALDSGSIIFENNAHNVFYEMMSSFLPNMNNEWEEAPLDRPVKISLTSKFSILRPYVPQGGQYIEDVFPPSTLGFYGRLRSGHGEFLYIIQEIKNDTKLWLTIANQDTGQIYEAHHIFPYEAEALSLIDSQEFRKKWYETIWATVPTQEKKKILNILESESVTWDEFAKVLGDIEIPPQKRGKTMRESLTPLMPESFPESVKEQLMLFLTLVLKDEIQLADPINSLYKFWQFPIAGALMEGHLMCLADNIDFPQYLKLLNLASKRDLLGPTRAIPRNVVEFPWLLFWQKTMEQFPNWFDIASDIVQELNEKGKIIKKVPISESAAKKSQSAWKNRLALLMYELRILGRVNQKILGLSKLVYLGAAYRWPHRHLEFITRLGWAGESTPHLQVMVMPLAAAQQVKRALPNVIDVKLTVRTSNITLFDKERKEWDISTDDILTSIDGRYSIKKLARRFPDENKVGDQLITKEEARILDLVSEGIRIAGLDRKEYLAPWGFDSDRVQKLLTKLSDKRIVKVFYEASDQNLVTLATIINGPPDRVTSVCSAFLDTTPTTLMMIDEKGEQAVLLTRLPETAAYTLASNLTGMGLEHGLTIRCFRPTTFQSFTHSLYQRLLHDDGTWDDDVSAFLSQARSKRKELSERNTRNSR